jgi:hypothetical protein
MIGAIESPCGWTAACAADGEVFLRRHGGGGVVRVRQAWAPATLGRLVDEVVGPRRVAPGPIERFTTGEGELASITELSVASAEGLPRRHALALVELGPQAVVVHGEDEPASFPETAAVTRAIAGQVRGGLGEIRSRPFRYQAPASWVARELSDATGYAHPDDPEVLIAVFHATPRAPGDLAALRQRVVGDAELCLRGTMVISTRQLVGTVRSFDLTGAAQVTEFALRDGRFLYAGYLVAPPGRRLAADALINLVRSIEPVPARGLRHRLAPLAIAAGGASEVWSD